MIHVKMVYVGDRSLFKCQGVGWLKSRGGGGHVNINVASRWGGGGGGSPLTLTSQQGGHV